MGIIDTGVDGTHPDIAPNFDAAPSHNFVTDMPLIDGPCEYPSCVDPANEDDDGHGTHVASTIGSPINGLGMAGVAPNVTLVNIRAGQDSGYFFLQPTLEALVYAGDIGVDVVNMSSRDRPLVHLGAGGVERGCCGQLHRANHAEGLLLQLRHGADRRCGPGRRRQ